MEMARPLGILTAFITFLMVVVYFGAFSISSTEISRSSNMSDTLHQAIESMALNVLLSHLDEDAKKDFIIIIDPSKIPLIEEEIRTGILEYRKAFPDLVLNETAATRTVAQCLTRGGVNNSELSSTQIGALIIDINTGSAPFVDTTNKYKQDESHLPSIKIFNQNSSSHPSGMGNAVVGYYIPPARQAVGPSILPIAFEVHVETQFLSVSDNAADDSRDKVTNSSNASTGQKVGNTIDANINFDTAGGGSDINNAISVNPSATELSKTNQTDSNKSNFTLSGAASGW